MAWHGRSVFGGRDFFTLGVMAFLGIDVDRVIEVKYGDSLSKIEDV